MRMDNTYRNHALGVCEKHNLPSVPCPACEAELENKTDDGFFAVRDEWEKFSGELDVPVLFDNERHWIL